MGSSKIEQFLKEQCEIRLRFTNTLEWYQEFRDAHEKSSEMIKIMYEALETEAHCNYVTHLNEDGSTNRVLWSGDTAKEAIAKCEELLK